MGYIDHTKLPQSLQGIFDSQAWTVYVTPEQYHLIRRAVSDDAPKGNGAPRLKFSQADYLGIIELPQRIYAWLENEDGRVMGLGVLSASATV